MPKDADPLSEAEIELIRQWIDAGAKWPQEQLLEIARVSNYDWWSFQPVTKPAVPVFDDVWLRTPIDAFILEKLQAQGLTHAKEADRRTLIRRVTYDLIGLPPTPVEIDKPPLDSYGALTGDDVVRQLSIARSQEGEEPILIIPFRIQYSRGASPSELIWITAGMVKGPQRNAKTSDDMSGLSSQGNTTVEMVECSMAFLISVL